MITFAVVFCVLSRWSHLLGVCKSIMLKACTDLMEDFNSHKNLTCFENF